MDTSSTPNTAASALSPERRLAAKNLGGLFGASRGCPKELIIAGTPPRRPRNDEGLCTGTRVGTGPAIPASRTWDRPFILTLAGVRNGRTGKLAIGRRCKASPEKRSPPQQRPHAVRDALAGCVKHLDIGPLLPRFLC